MIKVIMGASGVGKTTYLKNKFLNINPKEVAYLPQEVSNVFNPTRTIQSQIFEMKYNKEDVDYFLKKLNLYHLKPSLNRYPYEFSMGELQRIAILLIILNPYKKQIFLDEPTSFLDSNNQKALLDILKLQEVPITLVTHNLDFAINLTKNIKVMDNNGKLNDFTANNTNIVHKADINIPFNVPTFNKIKHLKIILIIGESGIGKTQYLNDFYKFLLKEKQSVGLLLQDYAFSLSPLVKVLKILLEAIKVREKKFFNSKKDVKEVIKIFKSFKLATKILKKYPHQLSLGEKQKVLIIRAILLKISKLLLDEPSSSMDKESEENFINFLIKAQNYYNLQIVIISHSTELIKKLLPISDTIINFNKNNKLK